MIAKFGDSYPVVLGFSVHHRNFYEMHNISRMVRSSKIYKSQNLLIIKFSFQSLYFHNFSIDLFALFFFIYKSAPRNTNAVKKRRICTTFAFLDSIFEFLGVRNFTNKENEASRLMLKLWKYDWKKLFIESKFCSFFLYFCLNGYSSSFYGKKWKKLVFSIRNMNYRRYFCVKCRGLAKINFFFHFDLERIFNFFITQWKNFRKKFCPLT